MPREVDFNSTESIALYLADSLKGNQPMFAVMAVIGDGIILGRDGERWTMTVQREAGCQHLIWARSSKAVTYITCTGCAKEITLCQEFTG